MSESYEKELARLTRILLEGGLSHSPVQRHAPISPESGKCLGCLTAEAAKQVLSLPGLVAADIHAIANLVYRVAKAADQVAVIRLTAETVSWATASLGGPQQPPRPKLGEKPVSPSQGPQKRNGRAK